MRRVSSRVRWGVALLSLVAILITPDVFADEPSPLDPPQAKIGPPIGASSNAKIGPPIGVSADAENRPDFIAVFWAWLSAKIGPPIGTA